MTAHYRQLLGYYRGLICFLFVLLIGGTVAFSTLFLLVAPLYKGTAKVSLLPTQTELAYGQAFVRSTTFNPANLLTQTHVEYLLSREIAARTVDRLGRELSASAQTEGLVAKAPAKNDLKAQIAQRFHSFRRSIRQVYNQLNSGSHVPLDARTDAVLSLQDAITVEMIESTYIMMIEVSWGDPQVAAMAANLLAEEYVDHLRSQAAVASLRLEQALQDEITKGNGNFTELQDQINALRLARAGDFSALRVIDPAVEPIYPSFPKVIVYTVFAFAGWIMMTAFVVICADTFSATVKTSSDLQRLFGPCALGILPLRRPSRSKLAELAKTMNLQCNAMPCQGAVTVIGSDDESRRLTAVIEVALRRLRGWQRLKVLRLADPTEHQIQATASAEGGRPVVRLGRPLGGRSGPVPVSGVKVSDLGGADEGFTMSKASGFDWVVIGLRPGTMTEEALEGFTARLKSQGVENIFAVFLKG